MKHEIRDDWTAALRSGEYKQGQGVLRTIGNEYCCLGVLCDLAVKAGIIDAPISNDVEYRYGQHGNRCVLPPEVQAWAKIDSEAGGYHQENTFGCSLAGDDDTGHSFAEIADIIDTRF